MSAQGRAYRSHWTTDRVAVPDGEDVLSRSCLPRNFERAAAGTSTTIYRDLRRSIQRSAAEPCSGPAASRFLYVLPTARSDDASPIATPPDPRAKSMTRNSPILVTGANRLAGSAVVEPLRANEFTCVMQCTRDEADLRDHQS